MIFTFERFFLLFLSEDIYSATMTAVEKIHGFQTFFWATFQSSFEYLFNGQNYCTFFKHWVKTFDESQTKTPRFSPVALKKNRSLKFYSKLF